MHGPGAGRKQSSIQLLPARRLLRLNLMLLQEICVVNVRKSLLFLAILFFLAAGLATPNLAHAESSLELYTHAVSADHPYASFHIPSQVGTAGASGRSGVGRAASSSCHGVVFFSDTKPAYEAPPKGLPAPAAVDSRLELTVQ